MLWMLAGERIRGQEQNMDTLKIGRYIQQLRKAAGMTQKELAEKLNVSFQAVSKWENGDALPDTGLLLSLCDALGTTADKLLNGGTLAVGERRLMRLEDVMEGFRCMERIGEVFGEDSTFFTGMVEGINGKMNIDLLTYLRDPRTREVMYAEVLIQGILSGRTVDMDEIEMSFKNKKMAETIRQYLSKAGCGTGKK
jgi:transcriptional regulator with XRE-family HTH domain